MPHSSCAAPLGGKGLQHTTELHVTVPAPGPDCLPTIFWCRYNNVQFISDSGEGTGRLTCGWTPHLWQTLIFVPSSQREATGMVWHGMVQRGPQGCCMRKVWRTMCGASCLGLVMPPVLVVCVVGSAPPRRSWLCCALPGRAHGSTPVLPPWPTLQQTMTNLQRSRGFLRRLDSKSQVHDTVTPACHYHLLATYCLLPSACKQLPAER